MGQKLRKSGKKYEIKSDETNKKPNTLVDFMQLGLFLK